MKKQHLFRELRRMLVWALFATAVLVPFERGAAEESSSQAGFLRPDFENPVIDGDTPDGWGWSSVTFFNGHVGPQYATSDGTIRKLSQSSFGQPVARDIPYPGFVDAALDEAWCRLYYDYEPENLALRDLYKSEDAAFRYKVLLYGYDEEGGAEEYIRAQFENMSSYWDYDAQQRAGEAADLLRFTLKVAPWDRDLRWSLLDIYYDTAVADLALAKEKMVEAYQASLGIEPPAPGEFLISGEIERFEEALVLYRDAMQGYFELLNDPLSVNISDLYPEGPAGVPFGYYLFREEVPLRSLMSSLRKDAEGNLLPPIDEEGNPTQEGETFEVFSGYKDLVLLFDIERDTARAAAQLARRYILRGDPGTTEDPRSDFEKALDLIADIQQTSFVEGSVLLGIYPGCTDEADGDSGLRESVASWRHALTELSSYKTYAENQTNLLGFTDDFLVLPQSQIPGDPQSEYFDSYNFFNAYLMDEVSGPLKIALDELDYAKDNYANYRDRQDQLAVQFERLNANYDKRLLDIVGAYPGDLEYDDPYGNEGSEMWVQDKNIEIALNHIQANRQEMDNLIEQVNIEIERRGQERNINNAIGQVYLNYGEKQAKLTEEIGYIKAGQAAADNIADAIATIRVEIGFPNVGMSASPGLYAYMANAVFQAGAEVGKGFLEAKKEKLAAGEKAQVHSLDDRLLDVNSKTQIKTWLLRMNTLAIESSEAALILEQEIGRLTGLQSEKEALERRKAEVNESLAGRYFADPSHRLLMESSVQRAQLAFERTQKWMFFTVRALEYRWNQKFEQTFNDGTYTARTLVKLRNAQELQDMYNAMGEWDMNRSIGSKNDDGYKKFSFRQDFLGYRDGSLYPDPISGKMVEPVAAFRSYLSQDSLYLDPDDPENPLPDYKVLRLTFSTAFQPESGGFFLRSRWLEKIMFMRVKALGGAIGGIESTRDGYLRYGGTSLIRNQTPGTPDPERPDRLKDETTAYATRYWYYDGRLNKWQSKDAFGSYVSVQVSNDPDVPPSVYEINVLKERSVAASEWTFYLAVESSGGLPLVDVSNLDDIEVHFYFYWYARP